MSSPSINPADLSPTTSDIDPQILAEITRALLPYLGPYSITTVKRASRSTSDPAVAVKIVADHIEDAAKRELFLKSARRVLAAHEDGKSAPAGAAAAAAAPQKTGGRPATPVTADLMQRGEAASAPIIGPLATVLVGRYAQVAENSRDFFDRLASHLRTAEERELFFEKIRAH
ncbi:MAG: hypothetical protein JNK75_06900 [Betaproteobacteria bacterium]|nr:hypothetical protein [Betaproteobacteria bacterium]